MSQQQIPTISPITLFYSYAHNDEKLRNELEKHLSVLSKRGIIAQWYDRNISAGTEWASQIDHHLNTAQIILLLISSDFLASDYCYSIEMQRAMERHDAGEARVIPILLRPVDWQAAPFAKLNVLPQNAQPVTTWANQDLAFQDVAIQIRKAVSEFQSKVSVHQENTVTSNSSQTFLKSVVREQVGVIEANAGNDEQKRVVQQVSQAINEFRRCQKRVEELKSIHNILHEIEVQLDGLSATIQLIFQNAMGKKKSSFRWSLLKNEIKPPLPDFSYIEIIWRQAALKIDDLKYYAAEEMKVLEDDRYRLDSGIVKGPQWVIDLFALQQSFEVRMKDQDMEAVKNLSAELLTKCRSHLYRIDKRLLEAVKELDLASDLLVRDRA